MDPFATRLLVAFVAGGVTVTAFTLAAQALGSRVGGLLLSLPVKVATALLLVALADGGAVAGAVAAAAPAGLAANVAFLLASVLTLRATARLAPALAAGLAAWLAIGLAALLLPPRLAWTLPTFLAAQLLAFLVLTARRPATLAQRARPTPGLAGIASRALGAGALVAAAVAAAALAGPAASGVLAVFPSNFLASIVILHRAEGPAFMAETARTMSAGLLAAAAYLVVAAVAYPRWPVATATALALAAAAAGSLLVALALRWDDARARGPR